MTSKKANAIELYQCVRCEAIYTEIITQCDCAHCAFEFERLYAVKGPQDIPVIQMPESAPSDAFKRWGGAVWVSQEQIAKEAFCDGFSAGYAFCAEANDLLPES